MPSKVEEARARLVEVLRAAHISTRPGTFYDLAETLGVEYPPTEFQIADALLAAVREEESEHLRFAERFIAGHCDPTDLPVAAGEWVQALHRKHFPANYNVEVNGG